MKELEQLIDNFDREQLEALTGIALRMATAKADSWTGKINFELNVSQGGLSDMHVHKGEVVRFQKKTRRIRSSRG